MDEYVDHMNERGHRVPDYEVSVLLTTLACWLLGVVGERVINKSIDGLHRSKEEEEARKVRELEETRHSELMAKMEELRSEMEDARETPPGAESAVTEDAAAASALLRWAKKENVRIDIILETEAEGDLKEAFEALTKDVPGSTTGD